MLVHKGKPKVAKNGENYMTLTLGDLEGKELRVLIFGEAFAKWHDMARGVLIGILNARSMPGISGSYAVQKVGQVLRLGVSLHFGVCKGTDPKACANYINKKYSKYCAKHFTVKPKALVRRLELSANLLPTKTTQKYMPEVADDNFRPPRAEEVNILENYLKHRQLMAQDTRKPITIEIDYTYKRKRQDEVSTNHKRPKLS